MRYRVVPVYGDGNSIFHVVDSAATEGEQPAIVASYDTLGIYGIWARQQADSRAHRLNNADEDMQRSAVEI